MIHYKSEEEIELLRESSLLVGKTLAEIAKHIKPGVETLFLDKIAEDFIRSHDAVPGFKGYNGFKHTLCISINDEVVHGIPSKRILEDGDIVSLDCGTLKNGFYGDSAYTFAVGNVSEGKRIGDIGYEIQSYVESLGYSVVRDLVGHGLGRKLHEKPEIPNYGKQGTGMKLQSGLVIAIEPMINLGIRNVIQERDGWTIRTADRLPSAHYEHNVVIRKGTAEILSSFEEIENVLSTLNK